MTGSASPASWTLYLCCLLLSSRGRCNFPFGHASDEQEESKTKTSAEVQEFLPDIVQLRSQEELDHAVRACHGPTAVLFVRCAENAESVCSKKVSVREVNFAADFSRVYRLHREVACFFYVACRSQRYCSMHFNVPTTPSTVVYSPSERAHLVSFRGSYLEAMEKMAASITNSIQTMSTVTKVQGMNLMGFFKSTMRPLKFIMVSADAEIPVMIQALSADPGLRHVVHFGWAQVVDNMMHATLIEMLQVKKVPEFILQYGSQASSREFFDDYEDGKASTDAVRNWIYERIQTCPLLGSTLVTAAVDEKALFAAFEGRGLHLLEEAALTGAEEDTSNKTIAALKRTKGVKKEIDLGKYKEYMALERGADGCPDGQAIGSAEECEKAIKKLGHKAAPLWQAAYPGLPRYCSVRTINSKGPEKMHFNSAAEGKGRSDLQPVCMTLEGAIAAWRAEKKAKNKNTMQLAKRVIDALELRLQLQRSIISSTSLQRAQEIEFASWSVSNYGLSLGSAAVSQHELSERVPQFNEETGLSIFSTKSFLLVYLCDGHIDEAAIQMLADTARQFGHDKLDVKVVWMDLEVERFFRDRFKPISYPSAVMLSPKDSLNFARLEHHQDQQGDFLPVGHTELRRLVDFVLEGKAKFSPFQKSLDELDSEVPSSK